MTTYSNLKFTDALERELINQERDDLSLLDVDRFDRAVWRLIVVSSILVAVVLAAVVFA